LPVINKKGSSKATNLEQSRYQDIIRSVNDAGQFIKAKQAIAANDKRHGGRNGKRNHQHNKSELPPSFLMTNNNSMI
jgi:hypothetical protein